MARSDHERVLAQMVEHLGLQKAPDLLNRGLLVVGGHELQLHHDEDHAPHAIQARLTLGAAERHQREWIWHRLLVSNYEWARNGCLGWSLSPEGDRVMFNARHPLDGQTTGAELATWLRELLACARGHWQALPFRQAIADIPALAPLARARRSVSTACDGWESLVEVFCDHEGIAERDALRHGEDSLRVDGMDMLLRHDLAFPGQFEVSLDLGMARIGTRETLWQGLLWSNFLMGPGGELLFSVHPNREAVVMTVQQAMPVEPRAHEFSALLHAMAAEGKGVWDALRDTVSRAQATVPRRAPRFKAP